MYTPTPQRLMVYCRIDGALPHCRTRPILFRLRLPAAALQEGGGGLALFGNKRRRGRALQRMHQLMSRGRVQSLIRLCGNQSDALWPRNRFTTLYSTPILLVVPLPPLAFTDPTTLITRPSVK